MEKIKVLVVDDHAIMRDGIRALLSLDSDIEIIGEAGDGREAIKKAEELSPDVIIMDVAMPDMDGLEATRRILKQNPNARIIILSQYDDREYVLSAIKAGSAGYVPKRALGSELVSAIRTVYRGDSFLYPSAASALIKGFREQAQSGDAFDSLTPREREILKLIAEGHTGKEIASKLFISMKTVMGHRAKIMEKLGLRNRTELI
ncbi:MAG: response regulator transcription factor, partial [Dehalococcoidales bacterium]|nr:response regulator transcription factor [Dehalococcoidales bacterium]